jgi:PAS domain S-box-containing protein
MNPADQRLVDFISQAAGPLLEGGGSFRELVNVLPAPVYTTDAAGYVTYFNEAAAAIWGRCPEVGKAKWCGSWRMFSPDGRELSHEHCPMAIAVKERRAIRGLEAIVERPDGSRVSLIHFPTAVYDEKGKLLGAVNMLVDISEQKRAEEASKYLAAIVESSDDAIVSKNLSGIITSWNNGAERIFGYRANEIIGRSIKTLIPPDLHSEEDSILDRLRCGERIERFETRRQRKDGNLIDVSLSVSPVKDAHGEVMGAWKIARDRTERKRADERQKVLVAKLRDSENRMRAIVNTAQNGIITIDDKGTIESLNPAAERIFGYNAEETVGRNVNMLMPEPFRGEHDFYLKNYLDTGQAKVIGIERELTGLRRNGSTFPMEFTVSEIAMAGRRMFVGVVHDITNRMRNAERQTTLMAELDHRVKNVLARVAMLSVNTRKGSRSIDAYVRSLNGRIQSMATAHSLLSQNRWRSVGLGALVGKQLAPYATGANVTIKGEDIMLGAAEIQAVAMVLHELVTNSAKYGSLSLPNGRVCVTWDRQDFDTGAKLVFEWREVGGPPVAAKPPSGYGTSLIRDLIPHELGGTVHLAFAPDGVSCKIGIPLEQT